MRAWLLFAVPWFDFQLFRRLWTTAHEFPYAAGELAAGQEDAPPARLAEQADVRADTDDLPLIAAAWMGLAQLDDIARVEFFVDREHGVGSFVSCLMTVILFISVARIK